MISPARRAWLKDKIHGYFVKKFPNLVRAIQLYEHLSKKYRERLLDDNLQRELKVLSDKAQPYFWAYLAGCCAPKNARRRKEAHSS